MRYEQKSISKNVFLQIILFVSLAIVAFSKDERNFEEKSDAIKNKLFFLNHDVHDSSFLPPTIFVAIFVRNKEHSLPYFFRGLEDLNYPKKRISLWIVTDHNSDKSMEIIEKWTNSVKQQYHSVQVENPEYNWYYEGQSSNVHWPRERHIRMLKLRQEALVKARQSWADFLFLLDADNILVNPFTLWHLITTERIMVSPMLDTLGSYSNFWAGQDEKGYYVRTDDYFPIKDRATVGVFEVPMTHSVFLINLKHKITEHLQFWPLLDHYNLELDDIIVFSYNCKHLGIAMAVDNRYVYGYMPIPLKPAQSLIEEVETFTHLLMEVMTEPPVGIGIEMKPSEIIKPKIASSKLSFDEIFMINLVRRNDRFYRMKTVLDYQGIDYTHFHAIDSKSLNTSYLKQMGIDMLPGFVDPYRTRTLTRGEIGCFLSHYFIWKQVVEKDYKQVMVLEDDIRFEKAFARRLQNVMREIEEINLKWDLIYIGRKRMQVKVPEKDVPGTELLVEADYSYWTLGYLVSNAGAHKLLAGNPLPKMVPVDEYLPIMFNKHPKQEYMDQFPLRNVDAYSVEPLLVYPTHYTGQENYFSDTETSSIWEDVGNVVYKESSNSKEEL